MREIAPSIELIRFETSLMLYRMSDALIAGAKVKLQLFGEETTQTLFGACLKLPDLAS